MSIFENPEFIRQVILDNYENPQNRGLLENKNYRTIHLNSVSCIDDFQLQIFIKDGLIMDIRFDGVGCAISTASTSILTTLVKEKSIDEARIIIDQFLAMIFNKEYNESLLQEAVAFKNISRQPSRIKCATICWNGLLELLEDKDE